MAQNAKHEMSSSLPLVWRTVNTYIRPQMNVLLFAILLMVVSSAMTGAMAKMLEPIIDKVFGSESQNMLWPVAIGVFFVFLIRGLATYGQQVLMNNVGQRVISNMQKDMFAHLIHADVAYFHGQQSGQLLSRFLSDTGLIRFALTESIAGMGKNTFTLLFLLGVMFYQDVKLSLISIFVFPAAGYMVARLGRKLRKVSTNTQIETGALTNMLGQAFQGNRHVKSYGTEDFEKQRVNNFIENIYRLMSRSYRTSAIANPITEVLSGIAIVTIIVYGGHQVLDGHTTAGKLFSFIAAFLLAYEPMKRLARLNNAMQMGLAALDRMYQMLDTPPVIQNREGAKTLTASHPDVLFDNVHFSYPDGTEAVKGLSFHVEPGKTVALVGASGAGKSTILNLIPRFYDVTGGAIRVAGEDIREYTLQSLRASMALVSQEVAVFNDTVRDNIAYGSPDATEEQIIDAAKKAAAHDFIVDLPDGYNSILGENGVKLSGGQRQRISIARAILKNAPILLLDEATSALDTTSERMVQSALEGLQKGRTTIVVAHRLSTIMNADMIYVMTDGRIVESGNHQELLSKGGQYARLYGTFIQEDVKEAS